MDKKGFIETINRTTFGGSVGPDIQAEFHKYSDALNTWTDEVGWTSKGGDKWDKKWIDHAGKIWNMKQYAPPY